MPSEEQEWTYTASFYQTVIKETAWGRGVVAAAGIIRRVTTSRKFIKEVRIGHKIRHDWVWGNEQRTTLFILWSLQWLRSNLVIVIDLSLNIEVSKVQCRFSVSYQPTFLPTKYNERKEKSSQLMNVLPKDWCPDIHCLRNRLLQNVLRSGFKEPLRFEREAFCVP